jgi:hypothetical protein
MGATTVFDDLRDALAAAGVRRRRVGIDLGTTKSCIAVARYEDGEVVCECQTIDEPGQPEGQIAVPSVVAVKDGQAIVGHAAKRLARTPRFSSTRARSPRPRTRWACATPMRAPRRDSNRPPRSPAHHSNTCSTLPARWRADRRSRGDHGARILPRGAAHSDARMPQGTRFATTRKCVCSMSPTPRCSICCIAIPAGPASTCPPVQRGWCSTSAVAPAMSRCSPCRPRRPPPSRRGCSRPAATTASAAATSIAPSCTAT